MTKLKPAAWFTISLLLIFGKYSLSQNIKDMRLEKVSDENLMCRDCANEQDYFSGMVIFSALRGLEFEIDNCISLKVDSFPKEDKYILCFNPFKTNRIKEISIRKKGYLLKKTYVGPFVNHECHKYKLIVDDDNSELNLNEHKTTNVPNGQFYLTSTPSEAEIYLDDNPDWKKTTPFTFIGYPPKKHNLTIKKENYLDEKVSISIYKNQGGNLNVKLKPFNGVLSITGNNSARGANIILSGKPIGTIPFTGSTQQGAYEIIIEKTGYSTIQKNIQIKGGQPNNFEFVMLPVKPVSFTSYPDKAKVEVDGIDYDQTPIEIDLSIATHSVRITKDNYKPYETSLTVTESSPTPIVVQANLQQYLYSIKINSTPSGDLVYIDNKSTFLPTGYTFNVSYGRHKFSIRNKKFFPRTFRRKITDNKSSFNKPLFKKYTARLNYVNGYGFSLLYNDQKINGLKGGGLELGGTISYFSLSFGLLFIKNNLYEFSENIVHKTEAFPFSPDFMEKTGAGASMTDSTSYGYMLKGGFVILKPFVFRIHAGFAWRQSFKYNPIYVAKSDFEYTNSTGAVFDVYENEYVKGEVLTKKYASPIFGIEIPFTTRLNIGVDYWLGSEKGAGYTFGAGFNF